MVDVTVHELGTFLAGEVDGKVDELARAILSRYRVSGTTLPKPRVGDPIVFRAQPNGSEHVARPCSARHRAHWLSGYIVLSCSKCVIEKIEQTSPGSLPTEETK